MKPVVVLTGQYRWCKQLAAVLRSAGDVEPVIRSPSKILKPLETRPALALRVGFRPGARTLRGTGFDSLWELAWRRWGRPREVNYWIGTDVRRAIEDKSARICSPAMDRSVHWAGAPWLATELNALGIPAAYALFPDEIPCNTVPLPLPRRHSLLTYIPASRKEFYGWEAINRIADTFPALPIKVVGMARAYGHCVRPNINLVGWIRDMAGEFGESTGVLRLVEHDAVGGTVREGLIYGRRVLYTYSLPGCDHAAFDDIDAQIRWTKTLVSMPPTVNVMGWKYASATFGRRSREGFVSLICRLLGE